MDGCTMHYKRLMKYGDPLIRVYQPRGSAWLNHAGYLRATRPGHPVAGGRGLVFVHRVVLYDKIGPGAHPCHWCGVAVTWGIDLYTDHLDFNTINNDPANLVPSCNPCNAGRQRRSHFQPSVVSLQEGVYKRKDATGQPLCCYPLLIWLTWRGRNAVDLRAKREHECAADRARHPQRDRPAPQVPGDHRQADRHRSRPRQSRRSPGRRTERAAGDPDRRARPAGRAEPQRPAVSLRHCQPLPRSGRGVP